MSSEDPKMGANAPGDDSVRPEPIGDGADEAKMHAHTSDADSEAGAHASDPASQPGRVAYTPTVDDSYGNYDDPYGYNPRAGAPAETVPAVRPTAAPPAPPKPPAAANGDGGDGGDDDEDEGMLRMSFMGHLEELRTRLIHAIAGLGVVFLLCLTFCDRLWLIIQEPAHSALIELGVKPPNLVFTDPMESFQIIWMKLPLLCSIFLASPWLLYQVWAFVAPGLYKKERRFAAPFVICSAGLFITGGLFAYFVAFRFGLVFLLGIGRNVNITPVIKISDYFDLFVNVVLGIGLVFEMPIIIFFLTLLRIASPSFLISHSRYAILIITIIAAIITPTPDVFNLTLFAVPMVLLYFVGVFASYILVLKREKRKFPWKTFAIVMGVIILLLGIAVYIATIKYHYKLVLWWPFLVR